MKPGPQPRAPPPARRGHRPRHRGRRHAEPVRPQVPPCDPRRASGFPGGAHRWAGRTAPGGGFARQSGWTVSALPNRSVSPGRAGNVVLTWVLDGIAASAGIRGTSHRPCHCTLIAGCSGRPKRRGEGAVCCRAASQSRPSLRPDHRTREPLISAPILAARVLVAPPAPSQARLSHRRPARAGWQARACVLHLLDHRPAARGGGAAYR